MLPVFPFSIQECIPEACRTGVTQRENKLRPSQPQQRDNGRAMVACTCADGAHACVCVCMGGGGGAVVRTRGQLCTCAHKPRAVFNFFNFSTLAKAYVEQSVDAPPVRSSLGQHPTTCGTSAAQFPCMHCMMHGHAREGDTVQRGWDEAYQKGTPTELRSRNLARGF